MKPDQKPESMKVLRDPLRGLLLLLLSIVLFGCTGGGGETEEVEADEIVIMVGEVGVKRSEFERRLKLLTWSEPRADSEVERGVGRVEATEETEGGGYDDGDPHLGDLSGAGLHEEEDTYKLGYDEDIALRRSLVNEIVEEILILGEAERLGIDLAAGELELIVNRIKAEYTDEFLERRIFPQYGGEDRWIEGIRRREVIKRVVARLMDARVEVTEDELLKHYEDNKREYRVGEAVRASMILVPTRDEAEALRSRLKKEKFADLAREHSVSPDGELGGDLGYFSRGEVPEEFNIVFGLPRGKVSKIVESPYGFHLFKVTGKRPGRRVTFDSVKEEIMSTLKRERANLEYREWMDKLKRGGSIEVMEEIF